MTDDVPRGADAPLERLAQLRLLPVAVVESLDHAGPLAATLSAGPLPCVEVTMRTPASEAVLAAMAADAQLLVGAGTVVRADQAERVVAAGARFVVTPGFSTVVVDVCRELGVPVIPGVSTATEVLMGLEAGLHVLKFFPAEQAGGVATLAALRAAFPDVRFLPTGGVSLRNLTEYLSEPSVLAVGGSWLAPPGLLASGDFAGVAARVQEAVAHVAAVASAGDGRV
jgi:2-dehydro-3-deoxyphosphogluconate aldolase/(4S)-4-hydroxy-2-oxoglutarate aldolase